MSGGPSLHVAQPGGQLVGAAEPVGRLEAALLREVGLHVRRAAPASWSDELRGSAAGGLAPRGRVVRGHAPPNGLRELLDAVGERGPSRSAISAGGSTAPDLVGAPAGSPGASVAASSAPRERRRRARSAVVRGLGAERGVGRRRRVVSRARLDAAAELLEDALSSSSDPPQAVSRTTAAATASPARQAVRVRRMAPRLAAGWRVGEPARLPCRTWTRPPIRVPPGTSRRPGAMPRTVAAGAAGHPGARAEPGRA